MCLHRVLARSGYISDNRNFKQQGIMAHFIVGTIAAGCVIAGFVIGLILIFKKR
jgi:hypothetical protein